MARIALGLPASRAFALAATLLLAAAASWAAEDDGPAVVTIFNREIAVLRATIADRTPAERAAAVAEHVRQIPPRALAGEVTVGEFSGEHGRGHEIDVGGVIAFRLYTGDLDPEGDRTLAETSALAAQNLREALAAQRAQGDPRALARGLVRAAGATALFLFLTTMLVRGRRTLARRIFLASEARMRSVSRYALDLRRYLLLASKYGVDAFAGFTGLILAYLWLSFVFVQFPYSAPWGAMLGRYLLGMLRRGALAVVEMVPGLLAVVAILLVTRLVAAGVSELFRAVAQRRVQGRFLDPETAEATRRIALVLLWVFALTVAFPYIPGSDSDAFKGVGVLFGLMLSLGSSGFVGHVMSGLVLVYSRAFHVGDYVRIGDAEGTVTRIGSVSTKLCNVQNEEVTLPNGVVVAERVINYTRLSRAPGGALVSTAVTIGYDAPWRQVHALLEQAALQTDGILREPAPYVVQRALSDFYVEYVLVAQARRSDERPLVLSRLHAAIQDTFNEARVQIMSPHFLGQPGQPVVVPPERWFPAPAQARADAKPSAAAEPLAAAYER
jgi:small-conductance mechanosensitive channel